MLPSCAAIVNCSRSTLLYGAIICLILTTVLALAILAPGSARWSY